MVAFSNEITTDEYYEGIGGTGSDTIDLAKACIEVPVKGGVKAQSSNKRTPRDQISDSKLYPLPSIISGDR